MNSGLKHYIQHNYGMLSSRPAFQSSIKNVKWLVIDAQGVVETSQSTYIHSFLRSIDLRGSQGLVWPSMRTYFLSPKSRFLLKTLSPLCKPDNFCNYLSLFVTIYHYLALFVPISSDYLALFVTICHYLLLFGTICHYLALFLTIGHYFVSIWH